MPYLVGMLAARRFLAACFILSFVSVFGHKPKGLLAWPADSIDTALAHPEQRLNLLDPNLAFEMSDVWFVVRFLRGFSLVDTLVHLFS